MKPCCKKEVEAERKRILKLIPPTVPSPTEANEYGWNAAIKEVKKKLLEG